MVQPEAVGRRNSRVASWGGSGPPLCLLDLDPATSQASPAGVLEALPQFPTYMRKGGELVEQGGSFFL